ncbi:MAG: NDP-hexose 2,3-dehydratase family protein [Geobacteraceae bacterium]|nr:NDP-hexose 2,3-dehydratase family protein [Geobacteraceae bacterium]
MIETRAGNGAHNSGSGMGGCQRDGFPRELAIRASDMSAVLDSFSSARALHDDLYVETWIQSSRRCASLNTMIVPLDAVKGWNRDPQSGNLAHDTGRFFSVIGLQVRHQGKQAEIVWDQPIIEQPEIGILGILAKSIHGSLHFCMQAKEEPGNIGAAQLSPTVQATYSNYSGAHGGGKPQFLEYFLDPDPDRLIFSRLQTEDGGRFLYKSNRNMIVSVGDDFPVQLPAGFIWLTLKQISALLDRDYLFNACTRSILSSFFWAGTRVRSGSGHVDPGDADKPHDRAAAAACPVAVEKTGPAPSESQDLRATLQWIDDQKACNHMLAKRIGLNDLQEWELDGKGFFSHKEKRFFRIVGLSVSTESREIRTWEQPIIENQTAGIIGLLVRNGRNGIELLMQAKAEVGNKSAVQLGPTVQFTQCNYEGSKKLHKPFLYDEFSESRTFKVIHESRQTEEGARFYREFHLHRVLMLPDEMEIKLPADYRWLPLEHIAFLLHLGDQVNSCARSILFCLF